LDEALLANGTTPFQPDRPWNRCYQLSVDQYSYWHTHVEIPCMLVISKSKASHSFLDGDAEAASSASVHVATQNAPYQDLGLASSSDQPARNARAAPPGKAPPAKKPKTTHSVGADGRFNQNRVGSGLCAEFNAGTCTKVLIDGWCGNSRHQRSKCLSPNHAANACSASPAVNRAHTKAAGKGTGKGRGKGKGKGY
jgi:hypothetical protein